MSAYSSQPGQNAGGNFWHAPGNFRKSPNHVKKLDKSNACHSLCMSWIL
jgi:hypothetical protein